MIPGFGAFAAKSMETIRRDGQIHGVILGDADQRPFAAYVSQEEYNRMNSSRVLEIWAARAVKIAVSSLFPFPDLSPAEKNRFDNLAKVRALLFAAGEDVSIPELEQLTEEQRERALQWAEWVLTGRTGAAVTMPGPLARPDVQIGDCRWRVCAKHGQCDHEAVAIETRFFANEQPRRLITWACAKCGREHAREQVDAAAQFRAKLPWMRPISALVADRARGGPFEAPLGPTLQIARPRMLDVIERSGFMVAIISRDVEGDADKLVICRDEWARMDRSLKSRGELDAKAEPVREYMGLEIDVSDRLPTPTARPMTTSARFTELAANDSVDDALRKLAKETP